MDKQRNTNNEREPVMIAGHPVLFIPHFVPGVGPRVFVVNEHPDTNNYSPDDARLFASLLKIAATEAESIARQKQRQMPAA